jgi:hypothetical protein
MLGQAGGCRLHCAEAVRILNAISKWQRRAFVKVTGNSTLIDKFLDTELAKNLTGFLRLFHVHLDETAIGLMDLCQSFSSLEVDNIHLRHGLILFAPPDDRDFQHL